jgi:hypothetical protein
MRRGVWRLWLVLSISSLAHACSCGGPNPICSSFWQSPAILPRNGGRAHAFERPHLSGKESRWYDELDYGGSVHHEWTATVITDTGLKSRTPLGMAIPGRFCYPQPMQVTIEIPAKTFAGTAISMRSLRRMCSQKSLSRPGHGIADNPQKFAAFWPVLASDCAQTGPNRQNCPSQNRMEPHRRVP